MTSKKCDDTESDNANEPLSNAEEKLIDATEDIKEKLIELQDTVIDYVKNNPLKAMGFTLLAGVIAAQIMRPRK
jgi:ElaB/YqjD/DUF883 family membrane-anchored ribosome-binding protein